MRGRLTVFPPHLFTFPRKDTPLWSCNTLPAISPAPPSLPPPTRRSRGSSNFFGSAFPAIQFRLSEALCVLPCRDRKAAIPGLAVGCLITNLLSPYGLLDLVVGTLATLLAAVWSGRCRSAWTAAVPPVVCNMVLVGAMLAWESTGFSAAFAGLFAYNALTVGIGEAAVCFLLGVPLLRALEKRAIA